VAYGAGCDADSLDCDIAGTYKLFEKCDAAQASLHKRVGGAKSKGSSDMFMFLDPGRNTKGKEDFFVFADNHRRLQYGREVQLVPMSLPSSHTLPALPCPSLLPSLPFPPAFPSLPEPSPSLLPFLPMELAWK
jgi:hypothetical protein